MRCCYFSGHCRSFHAPTVWTSWTSILDHCSEEKMSQDKGRALVNDVRGEGGSHYLRTMMNKRVP